MLCTRFVGFAADGACDGLIGAAATLRCPLWRNAHCRTRCRAENYETEFHKYSETLLLMSVH